MRVATALHWAMAVGTIILVRVDHAHQYVAWSSLIIMSNVLGIVPIHRFRSAKWRKMALIG